MAEPIDSFIQFAEEKLNQHLSALSEVQTNNPLGVKELNSAYHVHRLEFSRELREKMITLSGNVDAEIYASLKKIKQEYESKLVFPGNDSTQNQKIRNFS